MNAKPEDLETVQITRDWIVSMIIGLNLCPFASRVFDADTIRYEVFNTNNLTDLKAALIHELEILVNSPREKIETSFLIHPNALTDYHEYLDFLKRLGTVVDGEGFTGVVQLVGFHPDYQFQETQSMDPENFTNRSPFPMIHLLREDSISEVAATPELLLEIPQRNIQLLKRMGTNAILERLSAGRQGYPVK